jgi:hypothetical protein
MSVAMAATRRDPSVINSLDENDFGNEVCHHRNRGE